MSQIVKVVPRDDYCLEVYLDNGSGINLNFRSRLQTLRFGILSDKGLFYGAVTDGDYIRWGNELEISINEVFQLAQR
ncbi:DUF2442 domain-containing protein [Aminipila terrae]|uniref:DUF2442 domain-containing protein n=1 Tax=Aminipila terrae TaxID=2697030 RepID=A0A6P1MGA0_9FIRM|nr:DUF2442 domain-containing protein [Aminipila terrae]QHI72927.1 DUF2442 domain-containing protein [Aminipila terrae]